MRREFLMKGHPAKGDEDIAGWYLSEKLDGFRCLWDGGISRGHQLCNIPWANDARHPEALSTGLWSQYANSIYAPDWFLNSLPSCFLDGELTCGRGEFQKTASVVKKKIPIDAEWREVLFKVFSTPTFRQLYRDGEVKNKFFHREISVELCHQFYEAFAHEDFHHLLMASGDEVPFSRELEFLEPWLDGADPSVVSMVAQLKLPSSPGDPDPWEIVNQKAKNIVSGGGEGVILRDGNVPWTPKRIRSVLKVKPKLDAEGIVVGATSGEVGKEGRRHGLVGAFVLSFADIEFELSGFTNDELKINCPTLHHWAIENPGERIPTELINEGSLQFNIGDEITFTYRELTKAGKPKEARYHRVREEI